MSVLGALGLAASFLVAREDELPPKPLQLSSLVGLGTLDAAALLLLLAVYVDLAPMRLPETLSDSTMIISFNLSN